MNKELYNIVFGAYIYYLLPKKETHRLSKYYAMCKRNGIDDAKVYYFISKLEGELQ
jgi:hypothetical protein